MDGKLLKLLKIAGAGVLCIKKQVAAEKLQNSVALKELRIVQLFSVLNRSYAGASNQSDDGPEQPGIEFSVDSVVRAVDSDQ